MKRIVLIDGHPDPCRRRYGHALADAYEAGATQAGHFVHRITVAQLQISMLRTAADFESSPTQPDILSAQRALIRCDHVVVMYPLWLGTMPALLKAFFEQLFRHIIAFSVPTARGSRHNPLKGKSGRVVVTMDMSAQTVRRLYGMPPFQHAQRRQTPGWMGLHPVRVAHIDRMERLSEVRRSEILLQVQKWGQRAR